MGGIVQMLYLLAVSFAIRALLIPAYRSTDFDVHQNWLRITYQLPMDRWYHDELSKWTLDYPPLFAYFQCMLSKLAHFIDPSIVETLNSEPNTVYFQRLTVILSEVPYLFVLYVIYNRTICLSMVLSYFSLPFLLLDNIHFQYNIVMQTIFLLSIHYARKKKYLASAFTYACLINFKHIYIYPALAYVIFLLKEYIVIQKGYQNKIHCMGKLAIVTLTPFFLSFAPFFIVGGIAEIGQIATRLFPFQRGLIHEYWAPNFWALYHFTDKVLTLLLPSFRLVPTTANQNSLRVLPEISASMTTLLILLVSVPLLYRYWQGSFGSSILIFLCGSIFFLIGYHCHQKAITPYIGLLAVLSQHQWPYINAAILVNLFNLLPLLIESNQKVLRIMFIAIWLIIWTNKLKVKDVIEWCVIGVVIVLLVYHQLVHPLLVNPHLQFLPLMLNSVFSAVFNICWIGHCYYKSFSMYQLKPDKQQPEDQCFDQSCEQLVNESLCS